MDCHFLKGLGVYGKSMVKLGFLVFSCSYNSDIWILNYPGLVYPKYDPQTPKVKTLVPHPKWVPHRFLSLWLKDFLGTYSIK